MARIIERFKYLAEAFAIQICAFAVMSNHYHLVLFVESEQAQQWYVEEIQMRWSKVFPEDAKLIGLSPLQQGEKIEA